jgi:hypothetical protein
MATLMPTMAIQADAFDQAGCYRFVVCGAEVVVRSD